MSIAYGTHGDAFGGIEPGCVAHLRDGSKAYHYVVVHEAYRPYLCTQCPVTLRVCQTLRKTFGCSVAPSGYAMLTAVIKEALRHGPWCAPGGEASAVAATSAHTGLGLAPSTTARSGGAPPRVTAPAMAPPAMDAPAAQIVAGLCATAMPQRAPAAPLSGQPPIVRVSGLLDDIIVIAPPQLRAVVRSHLAHVLKRANSVTNGKDQEDDKVVYLGAHWDSHSGTATARGAKLYDVFYDLAFVHTLLRRGVTIPVPYDFFERLVGSVGWVVSFDWPALLHRQGLYATLHVAKAGHYPEVRLSPSSPCSRDIRALCIRAAEGRTRPARYFPARDVAAVVVQVMPSQAHLSSEEARLRARVTVDPAAAAAAAEIVLTLGGAATAPLLQGAIAPAVLPSGRGVVGTASDASLTAASPDAVGAKCWGLRVNGEGVDPNEVSFGAVPADADGFTSDVVELIPLIEALRRYGKLWRGRFLVFLTDNLGNVPRINKGRAAAGSHAHALLSELYALADLYDIDFVALWLPRAANQLLDRLSKCRSVAEARAWAAANGLRLREVGA